jgi:nicotinamide-nucleotide amidase
MASGVTTDPPRVGAGPSSRDRPAETVSLLLPVEVEHRAQRVLRHLAATDRRLVTAESCTGGLLAALFTDVPGVSHVFDRGYVVYDTGSKVDLLGVPADLIAEHTAVSRPVALAMAEGALAASAADVAIATTGYADTGPEPGLVHLAVARRHGSPLHVARRYGTVGRGWVRVACLRAAVGLLEDAL